MDIWQRQDYIFIWISSCFLSIDATTGVALNISLANVSLLHASVHSNTHHTLETRNPSRSCSFTSGLSSDVLCTSVGVGKHVEMACIQQESVLWVVTWFMNVISRLRFIFACQQFLIKDVLNVEPFFEIFWKVLLCGPLHWIKGEIQL